MPVLKNYGCNISGLAIVRGILVRSENRWLYRDVTWQIKNCSVWSAFESMLPLWWWPAHLNRDNSGGSAIAGIRATSVHQRCWNLKNRFSYKIGTTKNFGKLRWFIECMVYVIWLPALYILSNHTPKQLLIFVTTHLHQGKKVRILSQPRAV